MEENPWIREHKGFNIVYMGIPSPYTNVDDELGLVVGVLTDEDVKLMKKLFREKLGSSSRWESYPVYIIKTEALKLH